MEPSMFTPAEETPYIHFAEHFAEKIHQEGKKNKLKFNGPGTPVM